jgi:hypothetical protein
MGSEEPAFPLQTPPPALSLPTREQNGRPGPVLLQSQPAAGGRAARLAKCLSGRSRQQHFTEEKSRTWQLGLTSLKHRMSAAILIAGFMTAFIYATRRHRRIFALTLVVAMVASASITASSEAAASSPAVKTINSVARVSASPSLNMRRVRGNAKSLAKHECLRSDSNVEKGFARFRCNLPAEASCERISPQYRYNIYCHADFTLVDSVHIEPALYCSTGMYYTGFCTRFHHSRPNWTCGPMQA